jgi:hypothetical protein
MLHNIENSANIDALITRPFSCKFLLNHLYLVKHLYFINHLELE